MTKLAYNDPPVPLSAHPAPTAGASDVVYYMYAGHGVDRIVIRYRARRNSVCSTRYTYFRDVLPMHERLLLLLDEQPAIKEAIRASFPDTVELYDFLCLLEQ